MSEVVLTYDTVEKKFSGLSKVNGSCENTPLDQSSFFIQESRFDLTQDQDFVDISSEDWSLRSIVMTYLDFSVIPNTDGVTFSGGFDMTSGLVYLSGTPNANYTDSLVVKWVQFDS